MEKNSQVYQLLTLICMSGECSEKAISIFIPDQAQRNRLLAKLIANKLVKKYQKDNMTGNGFGLEGHAFYNLLYKACHCAFTFHAVHTDDKQVRTVCLLTVGEYQQENANDGASQNCQRQQRSAAKDAFADCPEQKYQIHRVFDCRTETHDRQGTYHTQRQYHIAGYTLNYQTGHQQYGNEGYVEAAAVKDTAVCFPIYKVNK